MKPVIGITTFVDRQGKTSEYTSLNVNYSWSVAAAGGLPVLLPIPDPPGAVLPYLDLVDGLLFSGGADVSPTAYGALPSRQVHRISCERDACEIALAREARARGIPILGICRGHQVLNVAFGGTLVQDIAAELPGTGGHSPEGLAMDEPYHYINVTDPSSRLRAALGTDRLLSNSFHHQAVRELASGFRQTARSDDGVLEAYEADEGFLVCVQFHPEALTRRFPVYLGIFAALVSAASGRRAARL